MGIGRSLSNSGVPSDDRTRVERAVNGDRNALVELLDRHGPGVERALRIGAAWQGLVEASDVMQVTYLEAFLRIGSFDPKRADQFVAWLRRIAANNLLDAIRELKAERSRAGPRRLGASTPDQSCVALLDILSASGGSPSQSIRRDEASALLGAAIDRLPADYATAVRLYDLEGRDMGEVAAAMGRAPGAVHMLRLRAHHRLRELLGPASQILDTTA